MIIQSAPEGTDPLAVMMWQHTALCEQFARVFGNDMFEPLKPFDLMAYVISHHDAGWLQFDNAPAIDPATHLPYNLVDTPPEFITRTSRLSPDFNARHHAYCGLVSSMHSWGLYNGRYGLSNLVLLDRVVGKDRALTTAMLDFELARQASLKSVLAADPASRDLLDETKIFQNYKQLQFIDTLALYFNRVHRSSREMQVFTHVPVDDRHDVAVTIEPVGNGIYKLSPFPFALETAAFAFAGQRIRTSNGSVEGGWPAALRSCPIEWEIFHLTADGERLHVVPD